MMKKADRERKAIMKVAKKKLGKKKFLWLKKIERDVSRLGVAAFDVKAEKKRHRERMAELERVQKRRRGETTAGRPEDLLMLRREDILDDDLLKKEDEFVLDQSIAKSRIRFRRPGAAKPIDILTLAYYDDQFYVDDYYVFEGLSFRELEELHHDIQERLGCLYRARRHHHEEVEFWEALLVICEWEMGQVVMTKDSHTGLHPSVETDVRNFLQGTSSYQDLVALQSQIQSEMCSGKALVVEYWEAVLRQIRVYKAKMFLKNFQAKKPLLLKNDNLKSGDRQEKLIGKEIDPQVEDSNAMLEKKVFDDEGDDVVLDSNAEVHLDSLSYSWHDKYLPRKPKYSVKVHTGYSWNKYNRTHYDRDNPPPKTVLGYKFIIFYPHLVDITKAPTCLIEKDGDNSETCILRFQAGPPYEDVAFRIANNEWEYSPKKGYKCSFEKGVLSVFFNFKRFHYRR